MTKSSKTPDLIFLDDPVVGAPERMSVAKAVDSGFVSTFGPLVGAFEAELARFLGVPQTLALQSGTAAIHMALVTAGIGAGDEVIVPDITFVATVNPVIYLGARPVLADVDPQTWNIDVRKLPGLLTKKTKAIVCVHLYGNPCAMDELRSFARRHKLALIEDATESLGATYRGTMTGLLGDVGCFSFNGNKLITTGSGGLLTAGNPECLRHARYLINQAKAMEGREGFAEAGYNYRMTNLSAALGLAQARRLRGFLRKKQDMFGLYRKELAEEKAVLFQQEQAGGRSSRWFHCISLNGGRDAAHIQAELKRRGIPSRRVFEPLHTLKAYAPYVRGPLPAAEEVYKRGLCLPSSLKNTPRGIKAVCRALREVLRDVQ